MRPDRQRLDLLDVDLRPLARPPRREPLQVEALVERHDLAVDPAVAEGDVEGFGVDDSRHAGALLGELQPDTVRARVLGIEPRFPLLRRGELEDRLAVLSGLLRHGASIRESTLKTAVRKADEWIVRATILGSVGILWGGAIVASGLLDRTASPDAATAIGELMALAVGALLPPPAPARSSGAFSS